MPSRISDDQLSEAIFNSAKDGLYPEDEQVVGAEVPSSALESLSKLLEQARADVKASIRELSRLTAPDIDGWISQAKQLRGDIDESQTLAQEIVSEAEEGRKLQDRVKDASNKVDLLRREVDFNKILTGTLQHIQALRHTLDNLQAAVREDKLIEAVTLLRQAEQQLSSLQGCENTRLAGLIRAEVTGTWKAVAVNLTELWNGLIYIDAANSRISIKYEVNRGAFDGTMATGASAVDLETVVTTLEEIDLLKVRAFSFHKDLDNIILTPLLRSHSQGAGRSLDIDGDTIQISGATNKSSIKNLFHDVTSIVDFLNTKLPSSVITVLSESPVPSLASRLIAGPLSSSVPSELDGIPSLTELISQVVSFADSLDAYGWQGKDELDQWVHDVPRLWLNRRTELSLNNVRWLLTRGLGDPRTVERVETQIITREENMFMEGENNDDWNAGWSDQEDGKDDEKTASKVSRDTNGGTDEDDVSAWDLEDTPAGRDEPSNIDDAADAWGWGDENETEDSMKARQLSPGKLKSPKDTGRPATKLANGREVTLKEKYNITSVPEQIIEAIIQIVSDGDNLSLSDPTVNPIAPAAVNIYSLPEIVLSMYRACAPSLYVNDVSGNMFLYNDSLYMAEQLHRFVEDRKHRNSDTYASELLCDVSALELFGKRAYGKEMELQRTILSDLLDGAQGFANCTEYPFAQECDLAISSTIDRLRKIYEQWKGVLSHSALLQSGGSLLSTIINKIIVDIEDMSDISEPESHRLTTFCNRIATLEDLFRPEQAADSKTMETEQPMPLTAVYTPHWLKFQYLSNILESSLVDIKYLWTEGELSLEFDTEEVVDLIEALFADSEHRRRAIAEVRRAR